MEPISLNSTLIFEISCLCSLLQQILKLYWHNYSLWNSELTILFNFDEVCQICLHALAISVDKTGLRLHKLKSLAFCSHFRTDFPTGYWNYFCMCGKYGIILKKGICSTSFWKEYIILLGTNNCYKLYQNDLPILLLLLHVLAIFLLVISIEQRVCVFVMEKMHGTTKPTY